MTRSVLIRISAASIEATPVTSARTPILIGAGGGVAPGGPHRPHTLPSQRPHTNAACDITRASLGPAPGPLDQWPPIQPGTPLARAPRLRSTFLGCLPKAL